MAKFSWASNKLKRRLQGLSHSEADIKKAFDHFSSTDEGWRNVSSKTKASQINDYLNNQKPATPPPTSPSANKPTMFDRQFPDPDTLKGQHAQDLFNSFTSGSKIPNRSGDISTLIEGYTPPPMSSWSSQRGNVFDVSNSIGNARTPQRYYGNDAEYWLTTGGATKLPDEQIRHNRSRIKDSDEAHRVALEEPRNARRKPFQDLWNAFEDDDLSKVMPIGRDNFGAAYNELRKNPDFANLTLEQRKNLMTGKLIESEGMARAKEAGYNPNSPGFIKQSRENSYQIRRDLKQLKREANAAGGGGSTIPASGEAFDINSVSLDGIGRGGQYAFNREAENIRFAEANLNKALTNEDVGNSLKSKFGLETDEQLEEFVNNPKTRNDLFERRLDSAKTNPGFVNNMMGNKVPQMAGGALLTAGLISAMSNSRGQQSNAQLYGQQQPYY